MKEATTIPRRPPPALALALAAGCALGLAGAAALVAVTGPWVEQPEAKVRLLSGWGSAPPAATESALDLGVEFALAPGWHVYWKNSGDAGYAPNLDLSATPGISEVRLLFPAPYRFDLPGDLVSFGYEREVIYPVAGKLRPETADGTTIAGRLDYLVCADECIPYSADLTLLLPPGGADSSPAVDPEGSERLARWRRKVPVAAETVPGAPEVRAKIEPGAYPYSTLELLFSGGNLAAAAPALFFESHRDLALARPQLDLGAEGLRFRVPIRPLDETRSTPATRTFAWTLTGLEVPDGALALEGTTTVATPAPAARRRFGATAVLGGAAAVVLALIFAFRGRRGGARSTSTTQEER